VDHLKGASITVAVFGEDRQKMRIGFDDDVVARILQSAIDGASDDAETGPELHHRKVRANIATAGAALRRLVLAAEKQFSRGGIRRPERLNAETDQAAGGGAKCVIQILPDERPSRRKTFLLDCAERRAPFPG
jgi:hypothetical protein